MTAPQKGRVVAFFDLGTNSVRLLVARFESGQSYTVLTKQKEVVRLGEGEFARGWLRDDAMDRAVRACRRFTDLARRFGAVEYVAVATSAAREARNCAEFLKKLQDEAGLSVRTVSGIEEARLIYLGVSRGVEMDGAVALFVDIGGGSTEIIWLDPSGGAMPRILGTLSIPVGVMTVAETYGTDVLSSPDATELTARIDEELANFDRLHGISREVAGGSVQMLGTSGTVTTLGGIHLGLTRYDRSKVDGIDVPFSAIDNLVQRLSALSVPERADIPCIGWPRADLMVAGCTLLGIICRRWPVGQLRVADRGLREGVLLELMAADGIGPAPSPFPATDSQAAVPL